MYIVSRPQGIHNLHIRTFAYLIQIRKGGYIKFESDSNEKNPLFSKHIQIRIKNLKGALDLKTKFCQSAGLNIRISILKCFGGKYYIWQIDRCNLDKRQLLWLPRHNP